jgi:uncharacterized protein with HEPN domain
MPLEGRDLARLRDIEIYASRALDYLGEIGNEDPQKDPGNTLVQDAILRCFEVIGEAARATSPEAKSAYPTIPWPFIIGMRNRVIHEYHRIDIALVFRTVREDLPGLIEQVHAILSQHPRAKD